MCRREPRTQRRLEDVEGRLDDVEDALAVDARRERQLECARRPRTAQRDADGTERGTPPCRRPGRRAARRRRAPPTPPSRCGSGRGRADRRAARASPRAAPEALQRELLLLVHRRIDRPARRVAIAPLAADRHLVARDAALRQPASEELLGPPVAPRRRRGSGRRRRAPRRAPRHSARTWRPGYARPGQIACPAERDVAGAADGGEAEAEARHLEAASRPSSPSLDRHSALTARRPPCCAR